MSLCRNHLQSALIDAIKADLALLSPDHPALKGQWSGDTILDGDGDAGPEIHSVGLKSLDLVNLATEIAARFSISTAALDDLLLAKRSVKDWADIAARAIDLCQQQSNPDLRAALEFKTSGTTGTPKKVTHQLDFLNSEIDAWATQFAGRKRIISTVPQHHIYGFIFTVLLSAKLDIPVIDLRPAMPGKLLQMTQPGDLIISHPAYWEMFAVNAAVQKRGIADDIIAVSSTAPLCPDARDSLIALNFADFIEIYGSSETAGIGYRGKSENHYRLLPYWTACETGLTHTDGTAYPLMDSIDFTEQGLFTLQGRKDKMVQIGGINVDLQAISATITNEFAAVERCEISMGKQDFKPTLTVKLFTAAPSNSDADVIALTATVRQFIASKFTLNITPKIAVCPG